MNVFIFIVYTVTVTLQYSTCTFYCRYIFRYFDRFLCSKQMRTVSCTSLEQTTNRLNNLFL